MCTLPLLTDLLDSSAWSLAFPHQNNSKKMGDAMKLVKSLYVQILFAVLLGVLVGHFWSQQAVAL